MIAADPLVAPVVLGIVEGLTEFLPVSSTGHLILTEQLLGYSGRQAGLIDVVIQVGAILAICWLYRSRLFETVKGLPSDRRAQRLSGNVLLAFLPAALVGALAHDFIKRALFSPMVVAISLIVGGVAILLIERLVTPNHDDRGVDGITPRRALGVGFCQLLSLVPGVSRSGATIMGGVALGIDWRAATEFSFFLAIPTMFGAAAFDLYKNRALLSASDALAIAIGLITSFFVAMLVVRWLVSFVGRHGFAPFGWYRIAAGTLALLILIPRA